MGSLDSAQVRALLAEPMVESVVDDGPVSIRMKYIGSGTVTSVTVTTATNLVNVTSDGGTDTYAFATYTTVGTLLDAVNGDGIFECRILDSLRTDGVNASELVDGAKTITASGYYDLTVDTSIEKALTYRVAFDRDVRAQRASGAHRVKLQEIIYYADVNAALANGVQVWKWDKDAKTETQLLRRASVDATATTINFASGEGSMTAGWGNELIVRVQDTTSLTDSAQNFLQCTFVRE